MAQRDVHPVTIEGKALSCLVCGHGAFWERDSLLNTRGLSFFNLDWANKAARLVVCDRCGHVHWFHPRS